MRQETGKFIIKWYDKFGAKQGKCTAESFGQSSKIAHLWESLGPGNNVVITRVLYNTILNNNKWDY